MPQSGLIYRVLVASPSDCVRERALVPDVIHSWNAAHSFHHGAVLEPVLWETHARPELGDRPQAIINKQLVDNCDILIGTFWTRLGTSTGIAVSGTAEEIEEVRSKGKKVLLYFSSAPVVPDSLDTDQYKSLKDYKSQLGKNGLYFQYESLAQLRELLQVHIASIMAEIHKATTDTTTTPKNSQLEALIQFKTQFEMFLRRLEAEWSSERDSNPHNTNEGKLIIASALDQVLSFRSRIAGDLESVTDVLEETSKLLRSLQRHQSYMDGGISFRTFWTEGDAIIEKLKSIPSAIAAEE